MRTFFASIVLLLLSSSTAAAQFGVPPVMISAGSNRVKPISTWDYAYHDSGGDHLYSIAMGTDASADRIETFAFPDAARTYTFQDSSGTLAFTSDVNAVDLATAYGNGSAGDQVIELDGTNDSIEIDNPASGGTDSGEAFNVIQRDTGNVSGISINNQGTGPSLDITTQSTGDDSVAINQQADGDAIAITASGITTRNAILINLTSDAVTTGAFASWTDTTTSATLSAKSQDYFSQTISRTNTATTGTVADNYDAQTILRTSVQNGAGGTFTAAGSVLRLENVATETSGTLTDSVNVLEVVQDTDSTGYIIHASINDDLRLGVTSTGSLLIDEKAAADSSDAGYGQLWVKSDTPNTLQFTDDAGTDFELATDADHLGFFAATTSAQFAGVISDETGTGTVVLNTSPTFATSIDIGDGNVTNVGDISLDSISSDAGTSIAITLGTDAGDDLLVASTFLTVSGDTGYVGIGTAAPGNILHLYSATDNFDAKMETDKTNGQVGFRFVNDAQHWRMFLNGSDNFVWKDITGGGAVFTLEAGAPDNSFYVESTGDVGFGHSAPDYVVDINGEFGGRELSADPGDPDEGAYVIWQSDGTGSGDDGDVMIKITAGATTKTGTLVDFSAL